MGCHVVIFVELNGRVLFDHETTALQGGEHGLAAHKFMAAVDRRILLHK